MRTCYDIEETDAYVAARELLLRRCGTWAESHGLVMSIPLAETLLDSRHFSSDGRLGYWTPAQVRRAMLEWIPEKVTAPEEDLLDARDATDPAALPGRSRAARPARRRRPGE